MSQATVSGGPTATPNYPVIPGCRLIGIAGQGGMGTVYRAEQASPRRIVAVKVLSQAAASPDKLAAFHREAETIARLEHPGILPVYGFGESEGRPYLLLRYLAGLGIIPEATLTVAERAPFDGPMHVQVGAASSPIALGREVTDSVFVTMLSPDE